MSYSNNKQVEEFQKLWSKMPESKSPFITSPESFFFKKLYAEGVRNELVRDKVKLKKAYFLFEDFGSAYKNKTSVGYFNRGSIVTFLKETTKGSFEVELSGSTFKVTQDASIGNTPAEWAFYKRIAVGEVDIRNGPMILELTYVINKLKEFYKK